MIVEDAGSVGVGTDCAYPSMPRRSPGPYVSHGPDRSRGEGVRPSGLRSPLWAWALR
jgi:hypothetical protein